jgi:hypothetical protein
MNESDVDRKLTRFFWKDLGLWPIPSMDAVICHKCHTKIVPKRGRPDIFILNPKGPTRVCEVKVLLPSRTSFNFDEISDKQREWLDRWEEEGVGFIGFGVIRPHGKRDFLDHLYLIPWRTWKQVEELVKPYQGSIPYEAGKGYRTELQENKYDIVHLFEEYELQRDNGAWQLPKHLEEVLVCEN